MNKISNIEDVIALVAEIRNLRKGFITDFYLDSYKHSIWIKNSAFYTVRIEDTLFLIKKNVGFWNVFYCSTSIDSLISALAKFKVLYDNEFLMFDIVGNSNNCQTLTHVFKQDDFNEYCVLVRMSKLSSTSEILRDTSIKYATRGQAKEIHDLLCQYFDVRTEQIPYMEELEEYIQLNHILTCSDNGKIIGFVIFELNKTTSYLRYWFVHPSFRDKKIGSKLLNTFFNEGRTTKRTMLWVIQSNDNAIKRYINYGFNNENMFDYVYTNKTIKYEG